jgi:hypothetical protein
MAVHIAAYRGDLVEVKRLVEQEGVSASEADTPAFSGDAEISASYPSHYAACAGHLHVLEYLVDRCGVDLDNERVTISQSTPLHVAAFEGQAACVAWMLRAKRVNVNATDKEGATPLMLAAIQGHMEIAELLADNGSHGGARCQLDAMDGRKRTAFMWAFSKGNWALAELLLARGADPRGVTYLNDLFASPFGNPPPKSILSSIQAKLAEPSRFRILRKVRPLCDAVHAAAGATSTSSLAAAPGLPVWCKKRMLAGRPLPKLVIEKLQRGDAAKDETFNAALEFVVGADDSAKPVLADHLVQELMDLMAPTWVPERR